MRNGNIVVAFGVLVIGILAAEGKLQAIWTAITTKGSLAAAPDNGVVSQNPNSSGSYAAPGGSTAGTFPVGGSPPGSITPKPPRFSNLPGAILSNGGTAKPLPILGSGSELDNIFYNWPAGYQAEWDAFIACYREKGNVNDCAAFNLSGKG